MALDDWVLCRIYNKKGMLEKHYMNEDKESMQFSDSEDQKPKVNGFPYNGMVALVQAPQSLPSQRMNDYMHFNTSESVPKLHTDSSGSEHAFSPEFKEVQSEPKWSEFEIPANFQLNYMDGFQDEPFGSQMQYNDQLVLFQDMFGYMQKPF
ncbi:NAC domain-containing protein 2 [Sesamum alatum]|uniref:NAC domain-containing protein 2 n=1 Tax=Sesamum alatum TaxID=300844 RepID=A0AAE1YAS2_9LAMI|nr:NAC domain-containing protein 2 [Sesamum alatum]